MASLNALGGKLIYCLRSSKTVVLRDEDSRLKCINVQEILKKADRGGIHFEPYGLAYDRKAESLWLVDKLGNSIYECELIIGANPSLVPKSRIVAPGRCPCTIDFHPQYGLLVAFFGYRFKSAGLKIYQFGTWTTVVGEDVPISHCCWLPNGGFAYVSRSDSRLHVANSSGVAPKSLVLNYSSEAPFRGEFRYVQGMAYSPARSRILVADANLGAIISVEPTSGAASVIAGCPRPSDSNDRAFLQPGSSNVWLGPIHGVVECPTYTLWLDASTHRIIALNGDNQLEVLGNAVPEEIAGGLAGTGMIFISSI